MVDKANQRVREMFAAIAPRYDQLNHLLSCNVDRYWRWRTVRSVPLRKEVPVLDLCTGTGDLALSLRKKYPYTPVVGADFCRPMLQLGRRKAENAGENGALNFVESDAQQLPFAENTFQLVMVAFGLRNVADTDQGLREMVRVCQPGGTVVVLEFSIPQRQPWRSVYQAYFRHVLPRVGQWLARNRHGAYEYLPESVNEFPAGEALVQRMRNAGLQTVEYRPLTLGIAALYLGEK